jgi:hypothetical protein
VPFPLLLTLVRYSATRLGWSYAGLSLLLIICQKHPHLEQAAETPY